VFRSRVHEIDLGLLTLLSTKGLGEEETFVVGILQALDLDRIGGVEGFYGVLRGGLVRHGGLGLGGEYSVEEIE
jgi:hypothetical protein